MSVTLHLIQDALDAIGRVRARLLDEESDGTPNDPDVRVWTRPGLVIDVLESEQLDADVSTLVMRVRQLRERVETAINEGDPDDTRWSWLYVQESAGHIKRWLEARGWWTGD